VRIVIAEDNGFFREALVTLLGAVGVEVLASVDNGADLLTAATADPPDIAIIDLRMPPTHTDEGLTAALELKQRLPDIGVLVLTAHNQADHAADLFRNAPRGVGYLIKDHVTDVDMLRDALARLRRGEVVIDPDVVGQLVGAREASQELSALSDRERRVLELMAEGRTNAGIGRILHLSDRTVEDHVRSIFLKLGLAEVDSSADGGNKRVMAVLVWLRARNP
jgi:DNA-binding NarL/FixJ family response regulator